VTFDDSAGTMFILTVDAPSRISSDDLDENEYKII